MRRLLIATKNPHKIAEIGAVLGTEWEISDLTVHRDFPAPEETGATFLENATIKALAASRTYDGLVLADDSGLEVDALGGAPGVFSARYAGPNATDAENRAKLLRELAGCGSNNRCARFRCAIAIAAGGQHLRAFDGAVEGKIIHSERGSNGFGYDALFIPENWAETFAQRSAEQKNRLSHRSEALRRAILFLATLS